MATFQYIKIDKEGMRFKRLYYLLGIFPLSDGWKKLPEISKVGLSKVNVSQTFHSARTMGNSSTIYNKMYVVYLLGESKTIRIDAGKFSEMEEARMEATSIAEFFGVKQLDFTGNT
jgi:hypothetical protein